MPKMVRSPPNDIPVNSPKPEKSNKFATTPGDSKNMPRVDKRRRLSGEEQDVLSVMRTEMREMFEEMKKQTNKLNNRLNEMDEGISTIKNLSTEIERSLGFLSQQIQDMDTKINLLENNRKAMEAQIFAIEERCEGIEKYNRKCNIEIRNVPRRKNEMKNDLYTSLITLGKKLEVTLDNTHIRDVYRIPMKNNNDNCSTLIIELNNTLLKSQLLGAAKSYNKMHGNNSLNSSLLGIEGTPRVIYLSENLTTRTKRLFYLARDFAKTHNYNYCWTTNGSVYLRKKEGDKYIAVKKETQLKDLMI